LLGIRALAGTLDPSVLETKDSEGKSIAVALRDFGLAPEDLSQVKRKQGDLLAYAELHIEQGPVLEAAGLPVGVVTAINGFTRLRVTLRGEAGHAGTVPMGLRRDALAAAAECVLAIERIGKRHSELVATVGRLEARPGAINVIAGEAQFTVDVRAPQDALREQAVNDVREQIVRITGQRNIENTIESLQELGSSACAPWLMRQLERAVEAQGVPVRRLPSGAGHDGMAMKTIADIAMLFVRCKRGISHNPAESISAADAAIAFRTFLCFIENFSAVPA
jgi:allantoate deiminase